MADTEGPISEPAPQESDAPVPEDDTCSAADASEVEVSAAAEEPSKHNPLMTWLLAMYAPATYSRWRIPPPAVLVHLCIGSVYAWSVLADELVKENPDWPRGFFTPESLTFSFAILFLGFSAAFAGRWVERYGPRFTSMLAALLFGGGNIIAGIGALCHSYIILILGYGFIGGCGLGIAYVSPVSTLIKWFPDRRGFATGLAVMGFGGGAAVAAQSNRALASATNVGWTLVINGIFFCSVMLVCGACLRVPPTGWKPAGWDPNSEEQKKKRLKVVVGPALSLRQAMHTYQFYFMWCILFINICAGISILSVAKKLMKDTFGKSDQETVNMVMFISFFNMAGRFVWAFISDYIGRQPTFFIFATVQAVLFGFMPTLVEDQQWTLFVMSIFVIYSMYGGGFSCIPAFLADMFGVRNVGAVHGVTLTAWGIAGFVGPTMVTVTVQIQKNNGHDVESQYNLAFNIICGMLCVMAVLVFVVRAVGKPHFLHILAHLLLGKELPPDRIVGDMPEAEKGDDDDKEGGEGAQEEGEDGKEEDDKSAEETVAEESPTGEETVAEESPTGEETVAEECPAEEAVAEETVGEEETVADAAPEEDTPDAEESPAEENDTAEGSGGAAEGSGEAAEEAGEAAAAE